MNRVDPGRRLLKRLALFVAPYAVVAATAACLLASTGELIPVGVIAGLQTVGYPFIFLPRLSDHTFSLKVSAARRLRPDVLAIGSSRANQWRSAMFTPLRFYNAGNAAYRLPDYRRMLADIGTPAPRVVIFSLDFFLFLPEWNKGYDYESYEDLAWGSGEDVKIAQRLWALIKADPLLLVRAKRDPLYGVPALGLLAWQKGLGTRIDGSLQYGDVIRGDPEALTVTVDSTVARVADGTAPFQFGERLGAEGWTELAAFVRAAREAGVTPIGIAMPYVPAVVEALNRSPRHRHWQEFQSVETFERFRRMGIIFFNFTDLASFGGRPDEFVDPFHPSEPAYIRMLRVMLQDPQVRANLPGVSDAALQSELEGATRLEAIRNRF